MLWHGSPAREQQRLFFQSCSGSTPTLSFSSLVLVQGLSALAAWSPSCCVSVLWAQAGTGNGHCSDRTGLTTAFPDRKVISSGQCMMVYIFLQSFSQAYSYKSHPQIKHHCAAEQCVCAGLAHSSVLSQPGSCQRPAGPAEQGLGCAPVHWTPHRSSPRSITMDWTLTTIISSTGRSPTEAVLLSMVGH